MQLIRNAATNHVLDYRLVGAIVQMESGGIPYRTRYEKAWGNFLTPDTYAKMLGITRDTEAMAQAHSYGLMQIMGATARGLGFKGYLSSIVLSDIGLDWGCRYLAIQFDRFKKDIHQTISSYNAGTPSYDHISGKFQNQSYVDGVMACYEAISSYKDGLNG